MKYNDSRTLLSASSSAESKSVACMGTSAQQLLHHVAECLGEKRLGHIVPCSQGEHSRQARGAAVGRDHYHRDGAKHRITGKSLEKLFAVHDRHLDVGHDDVDPIQSQKIESLLPIG